MLRTRLALTALALLAAASVHAGTTPVNFGTAELGEIRTACFSVCFGSNCSGSGTVNSINVGSPYFVRGIRTVAREAGQNPCTGANLPTPRNLPVNVSPSRSRQPLGGTPPVSAYFLDDNAYNRENDAFWVRGESRADLMLRAPVVTEQTPNGETNRPLRIARLELQLETGPRPNRVVISSDAETRSVDLLPSTQQTVVLQMPRGVPYRPDPRFPTNFVYNLSIESASGFIPLFETGSRDNRFLGVFVRLVPIYE